MPQTRAFIFIVLLLQLTGCGGGSSNNETSGNNSLATSGSGQGATQPSPATTPPASGDYEAKNLQLSWLAPSQRTDGSTLPMNAIGGYEITYINTDNQQFNITLDNPDTTELTLTALTPDTYQFYIFAYDQQNRLSPISAGLTVGLNNFLRI